MHLRCCCSAARRRHHPRQREVSHRYMRHRPPGLTLQSCPPHRPRNTRPLTRNPTTPNQSTAERRRRSLASSTTATLCRWMTSVNRGSFSRNGLLARPAAPRLEGVARPHRIISISTRHHTVAQRVPLRVEAVVPLHYRRWYRGKTLSMSQRLTKTSSERVQLKSKRAPLHFLCVCNKGNTRESTMILNK
jgi:hypothetical protein